MGSQPRSSGANALPPVYPNFALPCHATIRSLLDLPRVNIRIEEVTTGGTGWHEDFIEVREEDIEPWDDFNEENIDSMFGDLLDGEITWDTGHATSVGAHAHDEFRIVYERDIDMMFEKTVAPVVRKCWSSTAVKFQQRVNARSAMNVEMEYEGASVRTSKPINDNGKSRKGQRMLHPDKIHPGRRSAKSKPAGISSAKKDATVANAYQDKRPDWPVYYVGSPNSEMTVPQWHECYKSTSPPQLGEHSRIHIPVGDGRIAAVGDSKRFRVFKSSSLGRNKGFNDVKTTLAQMAMYAWHGRTRYGFVMNSKDVTFLRFFRIGNGSSNIRLGVQYHILPWIPTPGKMSASKGIWALGMLGMSDQHREFVPKGEMYPLNVWFQFLVSGQTLHVNHVSERLLRESPSTSIIKVGPFEKFREKLHAFIESSEDTDLAGGNHERDPSSIHLDVLTGVVNPSKVRKPSQKHSPPSISHYTLQHLNTLSNGELCDLFKMTVKELNSRG